MSDTSARGAPDRTAWWRPAGALDRFIDDLLVAEAQRLRPGAASPLPGAFLPGAAIGPDGLGFDSLERLALAAALGEALSLHHGGLDDALVVSERLGVWRDAAFAALERFSSRICFLSSGSSGPPRRHCHEMADLEAEMACFAALLPGRRRVVAAVPCHHIYGFLFTLLLPATLGLPVIDMRDRFPSAVVAQLRAGDLVIGHPGFWSDLVRAVPAGWPRDVVGVSSGAPCPDVTAQAASVAGLARLVQVYGASETSGIGWRDRPAAPYTLLPFWRRAEAGTKLRRDDARAIEAPDRLRWVGPARFMPEGRRDAAVQVGGINVDPAHVRAVLMTHPDVADARVRLMARHEGERLKAFVVPRDAAASHAALRQDLSLHVERHLSAVERPRAFSFGAALPQSAAGKPGDWPVPSQ